MNLTLEILIGAPILYCLIRFWVLPTFFNVDALGKMAFGKAYQDVRAQGKTEAEAFQAGIAEVFAAKDRQLAEGTGVPLVIIQGYRKRYPRHSISARILKDKAGVRYEVSGGAGGSGYPEYEPASDCFVAEVGADGVEIYCKPT